MNAQAEVKKQEVVAMTREEVKKQYGTMSNAIRTLLKSNSRGEVAKKLGIRYQWVRNVEITPIKKAKV